MRKLSQILLITSIFTTLTYAEDVDKTVSPEVLCLEKMESIRPTARGENLTTTSMKAVKNLNNDPCAVLPKVLKTLKSKYPKMSLDSVKQAFAYRKKNAKTFSGNPRYLMVADYSQTADKVRSMQIDLYTGDVVGRRVSHGRNSDKGSHNSGVFQGCKRNGKRTNATRPGFFLVENTYASAGHCNKYKDGKITKYGSSLKKYGKPKYGCSHGEFRDSKGKLVYGWPYLGKGFPKGHNGMRMKGLNKGVNDRAKANGVVMHGAWYNYGQSMGRSYGCPAFHPDEFSSVAAALKDGALYYSYTPQCTDDMKSVLKSVPDWKNVCSK